MSSDERQLLLAYLLDSELTEEVSKTLDNFLFYFLKLRLGSLLLIFKVSLRWEQNLVSMEDIQKLREFKFLLMMMRRKIKTHKTAHKMEFIDLIEFKTEIASKAEIANVHVAAHYKTMDLNKKEVLIKGLLDVHSSFMKLTVQTNHTYKISERLDVKTKMTYMFQ